MEYFSFVVYTLIFISILVPVAIVIFNFFDISFDAYGNYLLWFVALALFNAILPVKTTNIFEDSIKKVVDAIAPTAPTAAPTAASTASAPTKPNK